MERGKKFRIQDSYELTKVGDGPTTLNLVTYCKVSEITPGTLQLKGDGFVLTLKYNQKTVTPKIEFNEVTDSGLKRYWPDGITRIVFTTNKPGIKGKNELVITNVEN